MNILIDIYWKMGAALIVVSLAIHYVVVLPFLQCRGKIGPGSWIFNVTHGKDLKTYGEICSQEGKPLFWYNFLYGAQRIILCWVLGWVVLVLIIAIYK